MAQEHQIKGLLINQVFMTAADNHEIENNGQKNHKALISLNLINIFKILHSTIIKALNMTVFVITKSTVPIYLQLKEIIEK